MSAPLADGGPMKAPGAEGAVRVTPEFDSESAETRELGNQLKKPAGSGTPGGALLPREQANVRGRGPLDTPPAGSAPEFLPEFETRGSDVANKTRGETRGSDVRVSAAFRPDSTPEDVAAAKNFFEHFKSRESSQQVERANSVHGRVFSVMQFLTNAADGKVMYSQEQLDAGLERLRSRGFLESYAFIWQTKDRYNAKGAEKRREQGYGEVRAGDFVPPHVHIAVMLTNGTDYSARQISDAFEIPASRVRLGGDQAREAGDDAPQGRGAARRAFAQLLQYMTHERQWGDHSQADGISSWERGADD